MTPDISVVVVVGPLRSRAAPCLASLAAQGLGERLEVLLVDLEPEGAAPVPGAGSPQVRVLKLPKETTFASARARGVAEAQAPFVAFLEEHTAVRPGWAGAVLAAYGDPGVSGVGWGIVGANPGVGKADVVGLLSYGLFEPPGPEGDTRLLACDLVFHGRMLREGHRFVLAKGAVMEHLNETRYSSIALGVELFYRIYAPLRAKDGRWGPGRRALYVLATPVIPLYSLFLAVWRSRKTNPGHARLLLRNAPFVYAVQLRAAWGQALGLLFGPGDAEARLTTYELSEPRGAPKSASA